MARTTYPCPACYQTQGVDHQNGEEVQSRLCAGCQEEADGLGLGQEAFVREAHRLREKAAQGNH